MIRIRILRVLFTAAVSLALLVSSVEVSRSQSGGDGGRIYDPKRLRTQRERPLGGRTMSRPAVPEPDQRKPLRSSALIPDPGPSKRGGSGYTRKGKYFYETPKDIELTRSKPGAGYNATVPRPEQLGTERRAKDGRRKVPK
ncbi:MAG: hypothetical protein FJ148_05075 [Deltaproteobacteria bacterium]|nr:hypothetical protein [Deltaproteobacteria bacterium]